MLQPIISAAIALPRRYPRRMRLWLFMVSTIVLLLGVQALMPTWHLLPDAFDTLSATTLMVIFFAALLCEYMDSSLGMGYGTTLTPLLLLMGFEPLQVVPAVLVSELLTGLAAGLMHQRDGNVDFLHDARARRTALQLSALSTLGALIAVWVAVSISKHLLGIFITAIVLAMGVVILLTRKRQIRYRSGGIVAVGAVAAFNKGLSGGGYGPLVTAGQVVSGLPAKHAVAITLVSESLVCAVGLVAYLDWTLAIPLATGALLSVPLATLTVRRASEGAMRATVGIATLLLGLVALLKLIS
ncbi:MAG: sulfite exporter TauE/SafE family protein [Candidatus Thiodiazotropha sp.]